MFMIAPTPLPFACSFANSGSRSSSFVKSIDMRSPPRPRGIFTFARQCVSSETLNDSTPGISFAICSGEFSTSQTVSRGAESDFVPSTLIPAPAPAKPAPPLSGAAPSSLRRSRRRHLDEYAALLQVLPDLVVGVAAAPNRRFAARGERVLQRGADRVDAGSAALA